MLLKFQAVVIILVRTVKGYTILDKIRSEKVWRSKEFLHLPTKLRNGWHRKVLCKIWSSCSVVMAIFKMWHHVIGWMVPEILMAPHSFETLGTTYPTTPTSHPLKPLKPFFFFLSAASIWTDQLAIVSQYWHCVTKKAELDISTNHFAAGHTACKYWNWCNMQCSFISPETLVCLYKSCSSSNHDTWEG